MTTLATRLRSLGRTAPKQCRAPRCRNLKAARLYRDEKISTRMFTACDDDCANRALEDILAQEHAPQEIRQGSLFQMAGFGEDE